MLAVISQSIIHLIQAMGYTGVFILMTLESALIPLPSEVTMPFAGFLAHTDGLNLFLVILIGAIGNLVGSLIAYAVGYFLEDALILSLIKKYGKYILLRDHEYERSLRWFDKYGGSVVFFSRLLPGVRTFISLPAGMAKMNLLTFSLYTFLGSLIWSALLSYIGFILGKNWDSIHSVFTKLHFLVAGAIIVLVLFFIYKKRHLFLRRKAK